MTSITKMHGTMNIKLAVLMLVSFSWSIVRLSSEL